MTLCSDILVPNLHQVSHNFLGKGFFEGDGNAIFCQKKSYFLPCNVIHIIFYFMVDTDVLSLSIESGVLYSPIMSLD